MEELKLVEYEKAFELFAKDGKCMAHIWKIPGSAALLDLIMDHYQISAEPYVAPSTVVIENVLQP